MRSAQRLVPIWVLSLMFVASVVVHAEDKGGASYPGTIGMDNPCNGQLVLVDGTNLVRVQENKREHDRDHDRAGDRDDHPQISVELRFVGYGKDQAGNVYRTVLKAKGHFQQESVAYDVPYRSIWIGHGAPNFSMDGSIRIFVHNGVGTGSQITSFRTACRADADDHDKDSDDDGR